MSKLSEDLVTIRKEKRLSKQDVFEKCRLPLEIISSIEDDSIFSGKKLNQTYLRSYLRTYSKAIGVSDRDITHALDLLDQNSYEGFLLDKYLSKNQETGDSHDQVSEKQTETETSDTTEEGAQEDPKAAGEKSKSKTPDQQQDDTKDQKTVSHRTSKIITPESQEKNLDDVEWEDSSLNTPPSTSTSDFSPVEPPGAHQKPVDIPKNPELEEVDWASKVRKGISRPQRNRLLWIIIAVLLALALAISSVYWFWQDDEVTVSLINSGEESAAVYTDAGSATDPEEPDDQVISPAETEDPGNVEATEMPAGDTDAEPEALTTDEIDVPDQQQESLSPEQIIAESTDQTGTTDTLNVLVYALHGNLEPIRVHSDVFTDGETALRPYWVEHQEAMRFQFVNEITLQGALSRMVLLFNGHIIEDFGPLYMEGPRIQLSRSFLTEQGLLEAPPDDPYDEVPNPQNITDRPRFTP